MSLLHSTLFYFLIASFNFSNFAWAYPQLQNSVPTPTPSSSSDQASAPVITAVISTIALGGFDLGGETISGSEEEFTEYSVLDISSGAGTDGESESETTYYRKIVVSDAVFTTTTGDQIIPDTGVPGYIYTEIDTIVENASGYRQWGSTNVTTEGSVAIQNEYQTCYINSDGVGGGCSMGVVRIDMASSTISIFHPITYVGSIAGTTLTLPFQTQAVVTTSSPSASATSSQSNGSAAKNDGVSLESASLLATLMISLVLTVLCSMYS
ncbi:hypothetical protein D9757_009479 [Collybiopsis confluens]|uniref:Uncharacterized protein n=1 Tax=Collybiopsis confluens TaxID=2823264 RepID=A0A8H5H4Q9_9AGAR|nr:hypothetical protein D9757_009479 [Collybiopsis confluens]